MIKSRGIEKIEDIKTFKDLEAFGVRGYRIDPDEVAVCSEEEIVEAIKASLIEIRDNKAEEINLDEF